MDLNFQPLQILEKVLVDTHSNHIAITAGLGSGKTHNAFLWHILRCFTNFRSNNSCVVYPTSSEIKGVAIPRMDETLEELGFRNGKDFESFTSPADAKTILYFLNGHTIRYLSGDKPKRFRAFEYSHALVDECGDLKDEVFTLLPTRVRCKKAVVRQILWIGAPQGINKFADMFDSDTLPGWVKDARADHSKVDIDKESGRAIRYRRIRLSSDDNPYLPGDYIPTMMARIGHNKNLVKSYRHGYFCPLFEGTAYGDYNPDLHDIDDVQPDPHLEIPLTFDFNANPLSWISLQYVRCEDGKKRWATVHEADDDITQLDEAAVDFAIKHPVELFRDTLISIYGDSSGHAKSHKVSETDYEALAKHLRAIGYKRVEVRALRYNPKETLTVEAVNNNFSRDELRISRRCNKLKRSFQMTCWKKSERKIDKPSGEDWTHASDAFKYFVFARLSKAGAKITTFNVK